MPLQRTHVVSFSTKGVSSKEFYEDKWEFQNCHLAESDPILPPALQGNTPLEDTTISHLKDFLKLRKANLSESQILYLGQVIEGNVGFKNDPIFQELIPLHLVNRSLARVEERESVETNIVHRENADENENDEPMGDLGSIIENEYENAENENEEKDNEAKDNEERDNEEKDNEEKDNAENGDNNQEVPVKKILGYRTVRGREGDYYLFRVQWEDGDITEEKLGTFIDEKEGEETTITGEFLDFEIQHQKINFRDTPPPVKKRQKKGDEQ